jgi:iron complex transport system ATP-binding protein
MRVELQGLRVSYGQRSVLEGIDLTIERGELLALLGPNACGKTTLLRAIAGTIGCTAGDVALDGSDVSRMSHAERARRVAVVAQAPSLPEGFSAFECVLMGRTPHLRLLDSEGPRDHLVARAAMEHAGCWELRDRDVAHVSGGERQRIMIARALAQEPDLLLLDEPTSHLDVQHQVETFVVVSKLCREQRLTAVAVVHDITLAAAFADRVAIMSEGRIAAIGSPEAVVRPDVLRRVYGIAMRVIDHPITGRPIAVPDTARLAAPDLDWLERVADPEATIALHPEEAGRKR